LDDVSDIAVFRPKIVSAMQRARERPIVVQILKLLAKLAHRQQ
jgi:hypothetical protein